MVESVIALSKLSRKTKLHICRSLYLRKKYT